MKKNRACSSGKAVRFTDSTPDAPLSKLPSSSAKHSAEASGTVAPAADFSTLSSSQEDAVKDSVARCTRSGRQLGDLASDTTNLHAPKPVSTDLHSDIARAPQDRAQALSESEADYEPPISVRATRSGRMFAAKTGSSPNSTVGPLAEQSAAAEPASSSADASAAEPSTSGAGGIAAVGGSLRGPWERSLLGMGLSLSLPEEARWPDRGRPSTDHPRLKSKSASMMRRCDTLAIACLELCLA